MHVVRVACCCNCCMLYSLVVFVFCYIPIYVCKREARLQDVPFDQRCMHDSMQSIGGVASSFQHRLLKSMN